MDAAYLLKSTEVISVTDVPQIPGRRKRLFVAADSEPAKPNGVPRYLRIAIDIETISDIKLCIGPISG
jgi:hypothetical protein